MCGRSILAALFASALVASVTSRVEAQVALSEELPEMDASASAQVDDFGHDWASAEGQYFSDDNCDSVVEQCGTCCTPYGLAAGAEATYLKPTVENGTFDDLDEFDFEAAPRIWLMWQSPSGWGVRGRYWDLDAQQQSAAAGDFDDILAVQVIDDDLEVYAIDLEATRAFAVGQIDCWGSFGARHARLHRHQTLGLTFFDVGGGGGDDATGILEEIDRDLDGTGFTMALDMRRPLLQSQLAAICNLRGSAIWGANELDVSGTVIEVVPVGAGDLDLNDFQQPQFSGSNNDGMWISEIQAGGEWSIPICQAYGGGNAFIRVMFEGQWWGLPGVSTGPTGPEVPRQMHEFIGVTAAAGITR